MQEALPVVGAAQNGMTAVSEAPVVERFVWEKSSQQGVTLRVKAPRAGTVEVSGDFTNWVPSQLTAIGSDWWSISLPLRPGKYQMNLRINGGSWVVPPGLLSMVDEFGGSVGLLIVE
jgi:1,4-alpha-glucan branching enzyme